MNNFWKDKRVTAYIALKHHTRFITPIMKKIASQGAKINYLVGQAERSQEITAIETHIAYSHIFDFLDDTDTQEIYKNYHILRNNFAAALLKDKSFNLQMTTVLDKTLFATAQEYVGFKNYLDREQVDLCLALHELNRWGKMFSFHAKKKNIPLISFQEGLYTTATSYYDFTMTGHTQYSTLNLVWGQRTKEKLADYEAPKDKIIPAGNTHITDEINRVARDNIRTNKRKKYKCQKKFIALLLFSIDPKPVEELLPFFTIFQKESQQSLFVKFHPATIRNAINKWIEQIPEPIRKQIHFIHGEENTYDLIAISDLCVLSEGSTTGLEALAFGKPLVELKLEAPIKYDFSLAKENAAIKLTPQALANAIDTNTNFSEMMDQKGVQNYLSSELYESDKSIETVQNLMEETIKANTCKHPEPLTSKNKTNVEWSIILPVTDQPEIFITLLEAISIHCEDETYEVILIAPEKISNPTQEILKSLEGDVSILKSENNETLSEMFNLAGTTARGERLVFFDQNIAPEKNWLQHLKKGFEKFGPDKIFGAKILNRFNNIVHSGMVVDANNCPVSAYAHLDKDFPHTCKTRSFQMLNLFLSMEKIKFISHGGFDIHAGKYLFMDLTLRTIDLTRDTKAAIYLSDVELIQGQQDSQDDKYDDSIFFYSKWHGVLWENEKDLYKKDGVSNLQLNAARMTRAMETISNN